MSRPAEPDEARKLVDVDPELHRLLVADMSNPTPPGRLEVTPQTLMVPMRDGIRLATDVYLPADLPAPVIVSRTPYGRANQSEYFYGTAFTDFVRAGYVVVSQDCRATGDSEPEVWDHYVYESEDGYDCIEWITRQDWYGGFIGSCGASYVGSDQWPMAVHPAMSTVIPHVSGMGLGITTARLHAFLNMFHHITGKGDDAPPLPEGVSADQFYFQEALDTGFYNEPLEPPLRKELLEALPELRSMSPADARRWLWKHYASLSSPERAEFIRTALGVPRVRFVDIEALASIFGHQIPHDMHMMPRPTRTELVQSIVAPPLLDTGWYDWFLNDTFGTWEALRAEGLPSVAEGARLLIAPSSHAWPGYREGIEDLPELSRILGVSSDRWVMLKWYEAVRRGEIDSWPRVIYYLMGANEWWTASDWPDPEAIPRSIFLGPEGTLSWEPPQVASDPDSYVYDPHDPTPTVGGSVIPTGTFVTGSVDVSAVQERADVLVYTSEPLTEDLDVVGPLRMVLFASSNAVDTDFSARLTDVFPDGRALQLQNGVLRARYRGDDPELLEPGRVYRFEIDMWATANRFKAGHRIRVDIASADFPRFDRNANLGGERGTPQKALQTIYHDPERPSHLELGVVPRNGGTDRPVRNRSAESW